MNKQFPIRVLRIIARMNVGGPAVQIVGIETHLNPQLFDHQLVTGYCDGSEIDFLYSKNIELGEIRILGLGRRIGFFSDARALLSVVQIIRKLKPDIVHTHTSKAGFIGRIAVILAAKKVKRVHTFHGHVLYGYFGLFRNTLFTNIERVLATKTDVLISVGKRVRDELISSGVGNYEKFRVINPGLSISEIPERKDAINLLNLDHSYRYVSWIGRVVKVKRPDRLLHIASYLKENHPDTRILVAGDGPLRFELENSAVKDDLPIDFVGWNLNIENILAVSDLLILTSDNEGTPLSLIQAQMAGLPVVATDVGSVSEIVLNYETGFVVPANVESLNKAITKLLLDQESARLMGERARVRALELYSVERLVRDHEDIYIDLMKSV